MINRFKGLDLIECLKNYGGKFTTLYRRWWSKPFPRRGRSQDGEGIGWGHHFVLHKSIKRSLECWATSPKLLLNTGRGHEAPRKAAQSPSKESWGYCKRRTKSQRQKVWLQNFRTSENSWLLGKLIDKSSPKSLHTYTEANASPKSQKDPVQGIPC